MILRENMNAGEKNFFRFFKSRRITKAFCLLYTVRTFTSITADFPCKSRR